MKPELRFKLLQQEGFLFQHCLTRGITALRNANDSETGNFYVAFFQLSIGLERLMKTIAILDHMSKNSLDPPTSGALRDLGHKLQRLFDHLKSLRINGDNALAEIPDGSIELDILGVLDIFATKARYFNLDSLVAAEKTADPLDEYTLVIQRILNEDVPAKQQLKVAVDRSAQATAFSGVSIAIDPTTPDQTSAQILQSMFVTPALQDLAAKYATYHVIELIAALRKLLHLVVDAAQAIDRQQGNLTCSIPYMYEFLGFSYGRKSDILRKKRWP